LIHTEHASGLHSLPEHLVGELFAMLDKPSRKAFFEASKLINTAPSVCSVQCLMLM